MVGLVLGDSFAIVNSDSAATLPSPLSAAIFEPMLTESDLGHVIQVAVFRNQSNAEQLAADLRLRDARVEITELPGRLYSVTMGPFEEQATADRIAGEIRREIELSPFLLPGQD